VGKYAFSHWHDIYSNNYDGVVNIDDCVELIVLWQQERKMGNRVTIEAEERLMVVRVMIKIFRQKKWQLLQRRCLWYLSINCNVELL
jgi:hypothetical protein